LYEGFNSFFKRPEGRGIKPLNTNKGCHKTSVFETLLFSPLAFFLIFSHFVMYISSKGLKNKEIDMKRSFFAVAAALVAGVFVAGCATPPADPSFTPGTFLGAGSGGHGPVIVEVTFSATEILSVAVVGHVENMDHAAPAINVMPGRIVQYQSFAVDTVAGATATSQAILQGVQSAAVLAGLTQPAPSLPGTFLGAGQGGHGPVVVEVTFSATGIVSINVVGHVENLDHASPAIYTMPGRIVQYQSLAVDTVAGATATSVAILEGTRTAAILAGFDL